MERNLSPRRRAYDLTMRSLVWLCAGLTCALLLFLIGFIFYRGFPGVTWDILSGTSSYIRDTIGILPNILNTLYIVLLAMAIVLPLGVGAAIYLTEYAANRRVFEIFDFATETLTGIPSIIFGLVGMLFFVQKMDLQAGVLAGSLTLVVMILPTIVRTTQESLKTVPQSYREGALALGAGKWRMVRTVVLPTAVDGVVTDQGIAVNPRRPDVKEKLEKAGLHVFTIEQLQQRAEKIVGVPEPIRYKDRVVGVVMYRDNTIIDVIRQIDEDA